jgi:Glycine cleavage H-protein
MTTPPPGAIGLGWDATSPAIGPLPPSTSTCQLRQEQCPVAPVAGTVRARNDDLAGTPEVVNTDPHGQGCMFEIEIDPSTLDRQLASLMDARAYRRLAGA